MFIVASFTYQTLNTENLNGLNICIRKLTVNQVSISNEARFSRQLMHQQSRFF